MRSCHIHSAQPSERITLIWRRLTNVGREPRDRSMARNSESCQRSRPSTRSAPITSTLIGDCSRIHDCSNRTPGRLGSSGECSILLTVRGEAGLTSTTKMSLNSQLDCSILYLTNINFRLSSYWKFPSFPPWILSERTICQPACDAWAWL